MLPLVLAVLVSGCGGSVDDDGAADQASQSADAPDAAVTDAAGDAEPAFSIDKIPVSNVQLGDFPYITPPEGYDWQSPQKRDFDHFLFWTGSAFNDVEGKLFMARVWPDKGKEASHYEIKRNLEAVIQQAGGVKVYEGPISREARAMLPQGFGADKNTGLGDIYNHPAMIWVIRRNDRNIWFHAAPSGNQYSVSIVETKPFEATARLLPATELKQAIDRDGKVTVQVNFASDASEILPESRSQVDAIASMLKSDPALRLSIEGHTDNTGSAQRNQALSQDRAGSVKRALTAAGIAADRLATKGFGSSVPVAGNDSDEGKAKNRRVELIKL